jgi:hypothetical protein
MELFMNRSYAATIVAAVVTILLAVRVLVLRGSGSAIPRVLARLKFDFEWCLRDARSCVDDWIAANIANRERKAVISILHDFSDCESGESGLDRDGVEDVGCGCERDRQCRVWDGSDGGTTDEVGR